MAPLPPIAPSPGTARTPLSARVDLDRHMVDAGYLREERLVVAAGLGIVGPQRYDTGMTGIAHPPEMQVRDPVIGTSDERNALSRTTTGCGGSALPE